MNNHEKYWLYTGIITILCLVYYNYWLSVLDNANEYTPIFTVHLFILIGIIAHTYTIYCLHYKYKDK